MGLDPDRWYYYRFIAGGEVSPIGRTRTFPTIGAPKDRLRFAFASCQHYGQRYFTAYEGMHAIGLVPCFTPVRSPQSNGIAEAFVKTFKRDYVRLSARPDATALLAELDRWFEDYNEMHPHRALGMRSPRDFIRAHQLATCPV